MVKLYMNKNKKQAIQWLKASFLDLRNIEKIIDDEYLTPIVAFHSEQAIEKSLKAVFEYNKIPLIKTHNLEKLYSKVESFIDIDYDKLEFINELYIESRYPGDMGLLPNGKPTLEDAKEFYEFALEIFDKVCKILDINKSEIMK